MSARISIIVPVYNCEQYIEKCLKSLVEQTYGSIEILVVDDGSTDKTPEIIDQYAKGFPNMHIFHCRNKGVSATRNFGLSKAHGEYIGFVDADDFIEKSMYAKMLHAIQRQMSDWVECGYYKVYCETPYLGYLPEYAKITYHDNNFDEFCLTHIMQEPLIWNKLFKRSIILDNKLAFGLGASEDMVFCMEYALHTKTLVCLNEALYYYIQRDNSIMHTSTKEIHILELWIEQFLRRIYPNKMYEKKAGTNIYKYIFAKILVGILFSECAAHCSLHQINLLVKKMQLWDGFLEFCNDMSQNRLNLLKDKCVVSGKALFLLKGISICGKLHCSLLAAGQIWIFSRMNQLRRRWK